MRPEFCVEIGSAFGWSTCVIALALEQNVRGRLYSVDPHLTNDWSHADSETTWRALHRNLTATGLKHRVEVIRKTTADAVADLPAQVDFVFVDGDHSFEGVKMDWEILKPRLRPWSVVVFHDSLWEIHRGVPHYDAIRNDKMGVPAFLESLRAEGYPLITLDADWGLTLVQPKPGSMSLLELES